MLPCIAFFPQFVLFMGQKESNMTTQEPVSIRLEFTPNPNTLKFVVNRELVPRGAVNFTSLDKAEKSPLAKKIFEIKGISALLIGSNFITITKSLEGSWDVVADGVPKTIETHLQAGGLAFDADFEFDAPPTTSAVESDIEKRIKEVLDKEIRPAVAMDGGDITLARFEEGTVYLYLQGACSSCPSSTATLKMGVETRLKELIPEVKEVVQI